MKTSLMALLLWACSGLAQFVLYSVWVLHGSFKFGWGPKESGWSLFVIGVMSVLVQGFLLGKLLKVFTPQRLAIQLSLHVLRARQ